jgi:hypothetical protein
MKKLFTFIFVSIVFLLFSGNIFSQVTVKGKGVTSSTNALEVTNSTPTTLMIVRDDGNVGIGTVTPNNKLEVNGVVSSTNGGFSFPDGSMQLTAAVPTPFANVFTVAQSGGDFTTISAALGACTSPSPSNTYLIRVMPGTYNEIVNCSPYVHLKGAGKYVVTIIGDVIATSNCVIEGFKINGIVKCIGMSPTIIHNIISNSGDIGGDGIFIDVYNNVPANPWIIENEIVNCGNNGITCKHGSKAWIFGNKIIGSTNYGIYCELSAPSITNNEILNNESGGIYCMSSNPLIHSNKIISNGNYGVYVNDLGDADSLSFTIIANIIGENGFSQGGSGIFLTGTVEVRIISNDIYKNEWGININSLAFSSVIGNDIHHNYENGILCNSNGNPNSPVVIKSNHIYGNCHPNAITPAGIFVNNTAPIITHNNIIKNSLYSGGPVTDIDYQYCNTFAPMISLNVFDVINKSPAKPATGSYNVNSLGAPITP